MHGRMARGGHGLPKVSIGNLQCPIIPRPTGEPPLKWPYGLMALWPYGLMAIWQAVCSSLLPLWTAHVIRLCMCLISLCPIGLYFHVPFSISGLSSAEVKGMNQGRRRWGSEGSMDPPM
jgi:hypothetical protein